MRNIFALIGLGTVVFVGLGWYLDWYEVTRQPSESGKKKFLLNLNPNKVTDDVKKGVEQTGEIVEKFREDKTQSATPAQPTQTAQVQPNAASHFFSPPSAKSVANTVWHSLDELPPPPPFGAQNGVQPVSAVSPQR